MPERAEPTAREQIRLAAVTLAADIDDSCDDEPADARRIEHILHIAERIYAWATEPAPAALIEWRASRPPGTSPPPPRPDHAQSGAAWPDR